MASLTSRTRRILRTGVFAFALAVAPGAAILALPASHSAPATLAPTILADATSDGCTGGESMDAYSLVCVPDIVPNYGGAPSEMQLTEDNPGIGSPTDHGGR